jgi:hypothetical protein
LVGYVFISCGQRPAERETAKKIQALLKDKFSLESYLAFQVQGLNDIMKITEELKASDYYLFIDFLRKDGLPISLFTHQELALAHHVGFRDIITLQQNGLPLEGFLRYVQSNPEHFNEETDLLEKVEQLVRDKGWNKTFSRNLVVQSVEKLSNPITYVDHTGQSTEFVWHVKIVNRRPDITAVNAVCILDSITYPDGSEQASQDRSYLKWAGHAQGYSHTILPEDFGTVDVFSIKGGAQGLFLHSALDARRVPILLAEGVYRLNYKLFSEGFPLLKFTIEVDYKLHQGDGGFWTNETEARLVR